MIIIAGCLIEKDNRFLMVKEAKKKCYGQWNFPAGHLEENETIKEAAIREVYEETIIILMKFQELAIYYQNINHQRTVKWIIMKFKSNSIRY